MAEGRHFGNTCQTVEPIKLGENASAGGGSVPGSDSLAKPRPPLGGSVQQEPGAWQIRRRRRKWKGARAEPAAVLSSPELGKMSVSVPGSQERNRPEFKGCETERQKQEFFVDMTCEGCSGAVGRVLTKLGGVQYTIDLPSRKVLIESDHSVDTLLTTLKKTGKDVQYLGRK
ncbi:copper transport protein ATOX1 isoform X1 [Rhinatrema bivittatum]|uniref:copper transport protein ATOX1 isoform X1 n=1 Tax=Rhinatrema bivittatum TaxID=194408 RepID=UPI001126455C|nr:copper transport protein ATOX1 isoform X1 [Rhinatrema bivittatum]